MAVLCRFSDNANTYGVTPADIQGQWVGSQQTISGYISEMSLGRVDLAGSTAVGWFALPSPSTGYPDSFAGIQKLTDDCLGAAAAGGTDLSSFSNFAIYVNGELQGGEGMAFAPELTVAGPSRRVTSIYLNRRALTSPPLALHELGHIFNGRHTSNPFDPLGRAPYGDDPASPRWSNPPLIRASIGPGYDGFNRDLMGWVPAERKATFTGTTQTYDMARLTQPGANGPMLVDVPFGTGMGKYVISVRTRTGYDGNVSLPGLAVSIFGYQVEAPGVQIQRVDSPADGQAATVNSSSDSLNGATWAAGQTYTDAANGLTIAVNSFSDTGARVTVTRGAAAPTPSPSPTPTPSPSPTPTPNPTPTPTPGGVTGDNVESAVTMTAPGTFTLSTVGATLQSGEPRCTSLGATVWLKFTAPAAGTYTVTTEGSGFDTVLALFRSNQSGGAGFAGLVSSSPDACNDDDSVSGALTSRVQVSATAGEVITIQVGGYGTGTGTAVVNVLQ